MNEKDMELFKQLAENYGLKIETSKAENGNGGLFYNDKNGNEVKIKITDIFPEFESRLVKQKGESVL